MGFSVQLKKSISDRITGGYYSLVESAVKSSIGSHHGGFCRIEVRFLVETRAE